MAEQVRDKKEGAGWAELGETGGERIVFAMRKIGLHTVSGSSHGHQHCPIASGGGRSSKTLGGALCNLVMEIRVAADDCPGGPQDERVICKTNHGEK